MATHHVLASPPGLMAFAGDWHGNVGWANSMVMALAARGVTLIIHVGDFGVWPGSQGARYLDVVNKVAAARRLHVLVVDGNHEDFDQLARAPRVQELGRLSDRVWHLPRGTRWQWHGLRYGALGGATSVDRDSRIPGRSWWPQERLTDADVLAFQAGGPVDVAVTHDCPAGVDIPGITWETGVREWGEEAMTAARDHRVLLAAALQPTAPKLIVHGHYHVRYSGRWPHSAGSAEVEGLSGDGLMPREDNAFIVDPERLAGRLLGASTDTVGRTPSP